MDLKQLVSAMNIVDYYKGTERDVMRHPFLALFTPKKQVGLTMSYIKGRDNVPAALRATNWDAMPPIRAREGFDIQRLTLPVFRETLPLTEEMRQNLLMYMSAGDQYIQDAVADVYNDRANCIDGATATRVRMIGQVLSTGAIGFENQGVTVAADYGFNASNQKTTLTGNAQWENPATATPISDLIEAKRAVKLGSCVAAMNSATWLKLLAAAETKAAVYAGDITIVREEDVRNYLGGFGISILIVDGVIGQNSYYDIDAGEEYDFYPDNIVSIFPAQVLGSMVFGTTAEEADLRAGISTVEAIQIVDTGVAVVSTVDAGPPVKVGTTISMVTLPSFPTIDKLHVIDTKGGAG